MFEITPYTLIGEFYEELTIELNKRLTKIIKEYAPNTEADGFAAWIDSWDLDFTSLTMCIVYTINHEQHEMNIQTETFDIEDIVDEFMDIAVSQIRNQR